LEQSLLQLGVPRREGTVCDHKGRPISRRISTEGRISEEWEQACIQRTPSNAAPPPFLYQSGSKGHAGASRPPRDPPGLYPSRARTCCALKVAGSVAGTEPRVIRCLYPAIAQLGADTAAAACGRRPCGARPRRGAGPRKRYGVPRATRGRMECATATPVRLRQALQN